MSRARSWLAGILFTVGVLALGYWSWAVLDGRSHQAALARRLEAVAPRSRRGRTGRIASATRREAAESGLVGRLEIPRLGLSALIVEGTDDLSLQRGIGHLAASAFPGEPGNVALAAHRDSYFHRLGDVASGDLVRLRTPDGVFAYRVDTTFVVPPDRGDLLVGHGRAMLTLVTCYPFHWIGPAPERFVVRAVPVDPALAGRMALAAHAPAARGPAGRRRHAPQADSDSVSSRPAASYTLSRL